MLEVSTESVSAVVAARTWMNHQYYFQTRFQLRTEFSAFSNCSVRSKNRYPVIGAIIFRAELNNTGDRAEANHVGFSQATVSVISCTVLNFLESVRLSLKCGQL